MPMQKHSADRQGTHQSHDSASLSAPSRVCGCGVDLRCHTQCQALHQTIWCQPGQQGWGELSRLLVCHRNVSPDSLSTPTMTAGCGDMALRCDRRPAALRVVPSLNPRLDPSNTHDLHSSGRWANRCKLEWTSSIYISISGPIAPRASEPRS